MLPHKHLIVSGVVVALSAMFLEIGIKEGIYWVIIGGAIAALLDIDAVIAVLVADDLKDFGIARMFKNYNEFLEEIKRTGMIKKLIMSHSFLCAAIILVSFVFFYRYIIPVAIGIGVHLLSDIYSLMKEEEAGF